MAAKEKQNVQKDKQTKEVWRKPLQVPPRTNAMRSFYQGDNENDEPSQTNKREINVTEPNLVELPAVKNEPKSKTKLSLKKNNREKTEAIAKPKSPAMSQKSASDFESNTKPFDKLTEEDLSGRLGFEIEDLFDIHELLPGKSFDIYQTLKHTCDEKGRCKITQPELMRRTGIKNRRTFYKHEERLINLRLLEKRHLPGDHKGVVYRVLEMSDVLPLPDEMLRQFSERLENPE
jgi:hypothetical protein